MQNTATPSFPVWPQAGLWRTTSLVKKKTDDWASRTGDALVAALEKEQALERVILEQLQTDLDPAVASLLPPPFDGMLEFWFQTPEAAVTVLSALETDPAFVATASEALHPERNVVWLSRCIPQLPETGKSGIKFLGSSIPAEGWTIEQAQTYWRDQHPLVAREAGVWDILTRYIQFHGVQVPSGFGAGPLGVWRQLPICAEAGFVDQKSLVSLFASDTYRTVVRPDEEKFSQPGDMLVFLTGAEELLLAR